MKKLIYCSQCSKKNSFSQIDGEIRYHCSYCNTIHYQNPKPTATLICMKNDEILLVKEHLSLLKVSGVYRVDLLNLVKHQKMQPKES